MWDNGTITFGCLIIIAVLGVGIVSGVPIPFSRKGRETEKEKIEMVDQEEKSDEEGYQIKGQGI